MSAVKQYIILLIFIWRRTKQTR